MIESPFSLRPILSGSESFLLDLLAIFLTRGTTYTVSVLTVLYWLSILLTCLSNSSNLVPNLKTFFLMDSYSLRVLKISFFLGNVLDDEVFLELS